MVVWSIMSVRIPSFLAIGEVRLQPAGALQDRAGARRVRRSEEPREHAAAGGLVGVAGRLGVRKRAFLVDLHAVPAVAVAPGDLGAAVRVVERAALQVARQRLAAVVLGLVAGALA